MTKMLSAMRLRLDQFSIFDWISSPLAAIYGREMLVALRYKRYAALLHGLAAVLLLAILYDIVRMLAGATSRAELVINIVGLQCSALLLLLFIVLPALSAVTVAAERHQETEDLLLMALDDPISFLTGKLLAMLSLFGAFHMALLPFSVFTYFFAGIEIRSFFQITVMLYGTAFFHAVIGVALSRTLARPGRAVFWVYTALFFLYVVPAWLGNQLTFSRAGQIGAIEWYLNPLTLLRDLLHSIAGWTGCFQLMGLQALGTLLVLCLCGLAHFLKPHFLPLINRSTDDETSAPRTRSFTPIPDWGSPTYHRDCQSVGMASPRWALGIFLLSGLGAFLFSLWSARYTTLAVTPCDAGTLLLMLVTPLLVLDRCGKEMHPTSLIMLRVTRMGSEQVLLGKSLAAFRCLLPLALGVAVGSLLPLLFTTPSAMTGGAPSSPTAVMLVYEAALLLPRLALAVMLSMACVRFRDPSTTDLAITLVLSCLLLGGVELVRSGLFDPIDGSKLAPLHFLLLFLSQLVAAAFASLLTFVIALMRFEAVFDEGSDLYAVRSADSGSF